LQKKNLDYIVAAGLIETTLDRESSVMSGRLVSTTLGKTRDPIPVRDFSNIQYLKVWLLKIRFQTDVGFLQL
jgi:hypothetical protein